MGKKIFLIVIIVLIIAVVGYLLFVRGLKIGLGGNADIINITYGEMTVGEFKADCEQNAGEYREITFCGAACIDYAECGYKKTSNGSRLCYSSDHEEKFLSDCGLCRFGYRCGPAAGDFGPMHCRCAEYKTLHRMVLQ